MSEIKVQLPAIHLNGNSKQSLLDGIEKAYDAVRMALDTLREAGADLTNARNYYILPDGPAARERALAEHQARLRKLTEVNEELEQLAEGIQGGGAGAR